MSVYLVVVKRLGITGMMFSTCLGEKCDFALFVGIWFVTELGFHLFMRWYVLLFVWRGRQTEAIVFWVKFVFSVGV